MATLKEIEEAYQLLRDKSGNQAPSEEQLEQFAALLPTDKKERKDVLAKVIQRKDRMAHGTFVLGLEKFLREQQAKTTEPASAEQKQPKSTERDDKPNQKPEENDTEPTSSLNDADKKKLLGDLYTKMTQIITDSDNAGKKDSIADLQWNLPEDRPKDNDNVKNAKEKRRQKQANALRKLFGIPDDISNEEIIITGQRAVENFTLKKFAEQFKQTLTADNYAEIEAQVRQVQQDAKQKKTRAKSNEFVRKQRQQFKKNGYELKGRNGKILQILLKTIDEYKKENNLNNHDTERTNRPDNKKKDHNKGGPDMAEEKIITDEMKEKLKKLGLSDDEISALDYDAATAKLKANEDDGKPKEGEGDDKPKEGEGDDKPKEGDDKPKDPTAELEVTDQPKTEENEHTDEKAPWVIRKQKWFDENIKPTNADYKVTRADNEFEVEFAGGSIHYEAETKAVVSKDASYKVYEALLKDPDNAQRPVKFPENASEHLTNMLYAASILNETPDGKPHEMIGLDKSKLNMDAIEKALKEAGYGDAEVKKVKDYYAAHEGKPAAEDEHSHDDHGADLSDVVQAVKAEDFKRGTATNSMKFSPNGVYDLESGEVRIDAVDKDPKVVYYSGTAPTGLPADVKAEPLKDEEVKHIKEQAKPAIETEVRRITKDQARMKELTDSGLIDIQHLESGELAICSKSPEVETAKKAIDEYRALNDKQPQDKAFVAQVMANAPDVILKIHGDENTPQPQKDILAEKISYNNVRTLLQQRAELIDKGENNLTPKEKVALTKNYVALFAEYKKNPAIVETAMADDLKHGENTAGRTQTHEEVNSLKTDFAEFEAARKEYSDQAHAALGRGEKLKIQDYMKTRYPDLSPEALDKRTKQQIQFNSAYNQYNKQRNTQEK